MHYLKSLLAVVLVVGLVGLVAARAPHDSNSGGSFLDGAWGFSSAEGTFDRTLNVSAPVDLEIRTGSGHITVRHGDNNAVVIHAIVKARDGYGRSADERLQDIIKNPPIEQNGNSVVIGRFHDEERGNNVSISYEITTPAQTRLNSHTGSGGQDIDGVQGPVQAKAGSGSIHINNVGGNVDAHTGSGGVDANNVQGGLHASAGSGEIRASNVGMALASPTAGTTASTIDVDTGSGGIRLENVRGTLHARAGSGHISAGGQMAGEWNLRTGSGGVDVRLPSDAAFDLEAHTGSGSLNINPPVTIQGQISRREIHGKVRGGGSLLYVHTGSGGITVE